MPQFNTLLVGAHFRPPAKQVLRFLAAGTTLTLEEDNENQYDAEAVKVWVDPGLIPDSQYPDLEIALNECGMTTEQLMSTGPLWVGFVPASAGKPLAKARAAGESLLGNHEIREIMGNGQGPARPYSVTLGFAVDGTPRAIIQVEE